MKKIIISFFLCLNASLGIKAQIGYQVSLLNTATGEPRANVTVNAAVTITNSEGKAIYSGAQSATSNDFGVLSLTVGNASTFQNADSGKLPFFIEVSVDGQMIGRSQILNVPVAEVAKKVAPTIPEEALSSSYDFLWWENSDGGYYDAQGTAVQLSGGGTFELEEWEIEASNRKTIGKYSGSYDVEGNTVYLYSDSGPRLFVMRYKNGKMYLINEDF